MRYEPISMPSERRGPWSLLSRPLIYETFHHLIGARRWMKRFARDVVRARDDDRVFDVGCGPGALLGCLPATTVYIGFDHNPAYIERARRSHAGRGQFICDDVGNFGKHALAPADVAVAIGVLHHLDDELGTSLLHAVAGALKAGGRLVTVDPCFHPGQNWVRRFVVGHDRGRHVRTFGHNVELLRTVFPDVRATLRQHSFPLPVSVCIAEATRPAPRRRVGERR